MAHQRRVKAIQAATKLTRDVSSDTASQAVNFWSSLESALEGIEAQVKCKEVRMVMDALRNAKRFHVTVSVIADTELKGATDHGTIARIKAVQVVTKFTGDVSLGTASQEVNFWLSLEWALEGIEAPLRSEEERMAMDALRNAKKFHATFSFIVDTGRIQVQPSNDSDFPLNSLLSSTTSSKNSIGRRPSADLEIPLASVHLTSPSNVSSHKRWLALREKEGWEGGSI
ncbi:uncharacterized protein LACBIDRAFT_304176 [Laccaria bicolor S238N-H82]|uniref:Predicted protein n=1 Tax=Laccaria bicolor (strain S238N-H82 / ATCC MYA-4686) TaxID=486041 RepID=B0DL45_LACBS|nr:uncharacterized protein LACBIDRAFT_304176 [Laccaria bicolor S238N-H82]EDR04844.1 predicted protein [Laccaria bicolor S238N-H82]|eukprot:XP_001884668.1 predicted protein [Laccaria bicolor S238N-H82]